MILTCPNCSAQYNLNDDVLGAGSKSVRCTSCDEIWTQEPESSVDKNTAEDIIFKDSLEEHEDHIAEETPIDVDDDIPESVKPIIEDEQDDDTDDKQDGFLFGPKAPLYGWLSAAVIVLLCLSGLMLAKNTVLNVLPSAAGFYKILGVETKPAGAGLVFDRIVVEMQEDDTYVVSGTIINLTSDKARVPMVDVVLLGEGGAVVSHQKFPPPMDELSAEQMVEMEYMVGETASTIQSARVGFTHEKAATEHVVSHDNNHDEHGSEESHH